MINNEIIEIKKIENILIILFNDDLLMFINILYLFKIKINFINIMIFREKKIDFYSSLYNILYLNYNDKYIVFANLIKR